MTRTLICLGALFAAAGAAAQTASQRELEACLAIERAITSLDCFETLTLRGATTQSATPAPAAVEEPAQSRQVAPEPASEMDVGQALEAVVEPTSPEAVAEPSPDTSPDRLENIGAEQLPGNRREEQERSDIAATVTEVREGPRGNLLFHLENGQVWRQIEARHVPLPGDAPFPVSISRGFFGEYRLRVGGEGRLVRIRRMQ